MGKSKDLATGNSAAYVETAGDTMTGNLGIGASPSIPLQVEKAGGGNFVASFQNTTSGTPYGVHVKDASSGSNGYPLLQVTNSAGSSTYFRVDSGTGNVTTPNQPCFIATRNSNHSIGTTDAVIPIDNEDLDVGNNYNTSTYSFTAPIAGNYLFAFQGTINSISSGTYNAIYLRKNGGGTGYRFRTLTGSGWTGINGSCIIALAANDYVNMYGYTHTGSMTLQGAEIHFMGYLLG